MEKEKEISKKKEISNQEKIDKRKKNVYVQVYHNSSSILN